MTFIRKLARSDLGTWLRTRPRRSVLGAVARTAWRPVRWLDGALRRVRPAHRAHDRRQRAILAAFERDIPPAAAQGPAGSDSASAAGRGGA